MKEKGKVILKEKWNPGAHEAPSARALEMVEVRKDSYRESPFPIGLDAQKRLLELIYKRKSGIITRQELVDVLFNTEGAESGPIIRCFT